MQCWWCFLKSVTNLFLTNRKIMSKNRISSFLERYKKSKNLYILMTEYDFNIF